MACIVSVWELFLRIRAVSWPSSGRGDLAKLVRHEVRPAEGLRIQSGMPTVCSHLDEIQDVSPKTNGCEECLKLGDEWVHLRMCLICGHVGCCDSSKNKHATKHYGKTDHPLMRSIQPGEDWGWCYVDEVEIAV